MGAGAIPPAVAPRGAADAAAAGTSSRGRVRSNHAARGVAASASRGSEEDDDPTSQAFRRRSESGSQELII